MRSSQRRIRNLLVIGYFFVCATIHGSVRGQSHNREDDRLTCPQVRERRAWNDLSCEEQDAFLTSIRRLKVTGIYDTFVQVHVENERFAHGVPEFLPWHRWFIYQFETALRLVADPPYRCMTLPYWDWELDAGNEGLSSVFSFEAFSSFVGTNRDGRCRFPVPRGDGSGYCLGRAFNFDFSFWGEGRLVAMIRGYSQYGDDFPNDPFRVNGFRAALEGGPHAATHNFIGGNMITEDAPNDPLFWIHHANVDRIWSLFQDYHGHTNVPFLSYTVPRHYEGSLLDVPMAFDRTDNWDFRIRNLRPPTPREVLSNNGVLLNVRYVHRNPIPTQRGYVTDRQWFGTTPIQMDRCWQRFHSNDPRRQLTLSEAESSSGNMTKSNEQRFLRGHETNSRWNEQRSYIFPSRSTRIDTEKDKDADAVKLCLQGNNFQRPQDHEQWDDLCRGLPQTHATLEERLDRLAVQDCNQLGNPYSAVDDDWIERMGMSNERATFDCYHPADENERISSR